MRSPLSEDFESSSAIDDADDELSQLIGGGEQEGDATEKAPIGQNPVFAEDGRLSWWVRRMIDGSPRTLTASVGDWKTGAKNEVEDVMAVQDLLLNASQVLRKPKLAPSGDPPSVIPAPPATSATVEAIREFQKWYCNMRRPDGRVDPKGRTLARLNLLMASPLTAVAVPKWIDIARQELGQREESGLSANNPRILEYLATFSFLSEYRYKVKNKKTGKKVKTAYTMSQVDETPWCACFVNWCLQKAGQPVHDSARAKDWLNYGVALDQPRLGAIVVLYKKPGKSTAGTTSSGYHVGFYISGIGSDLVILGGNQSNQVSEKAMSGWTVKGYRWPV